MEAIEKHGQTHVMTLDQAVGTFVKNGSHISIGGFTLNRNPMAAVHEIIRQGIRDLHLYAHSNGQGLDELVGSGTVSAVELAYSGNGRFAPTCLCFRRFATQKRVRVEDYSNFQMALRFAAGAMGVPFLPTFSSLGTDIIEKWGFDTAMRQADPRLSIKKLTLMDNPFSRSEVPEKLVLVPAIQPDVTLIHAQTADTRGTVRIKGLTFSDVEQAKASRHVIVTCDELVEPGVLNQNPQANQLPSFCVDAVVHVPFGAYPTACYGIYDYDAEFLDLYRDLAGSDARFQNYIREYIVDTGNHAGFLEKACGTRIQDILADAETGYSGRIRRHP